MGIVGSVVDTQTVVTLTEKSFSLPLPTNNLTIVGIFHNNQYVKVNWDPSRVAIFPNSGGKATAGAVTQIEGVMRRAHFTMNGTNINYAALNIGTSSTVVFYYGTPLPQSQSFTMFTGIVATSTLSGGSGTATFTFPSGTLSMIGFAASSTQTAATTILQIAFATSPGQTFNAYYPMNIQTQSVTNDDIMSLSLKVSITVTLTLTLGTGADVVYLYAYYQ